jgi:hypothetical protein
MLLAEILEQPWSRKWEVDSLSQRQASSGSHTRSSCTELDTALEADAASTQKGIVKMKRGKANLKALNPEPGTEQVNK